MQATPSSPATALLFGDLSRAFLLSFALATLALLGGFLGAVIGVLFGWALQGALASLGIDRLSIPVVSIALYLVAAGLAGVIAARGGQADVLGTSRSYGP